MKMFRNGDHLTITNLGPKVRTLKVETPLGIVNIFMDLCDYNGRKVERVMMVPDNFVGEQKVALRGTRFVQLKRRA